jgi:hypothetical protein
MMMMIRGATVTLHRFPSALSPVPQLEALYNAGLALIAVAARGDRVGLQSGLLQQAQRLLQVIDELYLESQYCGEPGWNASGTIEGPLGPEFDPPSSITVPLRGRSAHASDC